LTIRRSPQPDEILKDHTILKILSTFAAEMGLKPRRPYIIDILVTDIWGFG
jgi:hypothetical protein